MTKQVIFNPLSGKFDFIDVGGGTTGLAFANQEYTPTYCYVGMDTGTTWQIYRRTRSTNVREYASGASDYATNWTNRSSLTYS